MIGLKTTIYRLRENSCINAKKATFLLTGDFDFLSYTAALETLLLANRVVNQEVFAVTVIRKRVHDVVSPMCTAPKLCTIFQ
jgi:hypothetical protein